MVTFLHTLLLCEKLEFNTALVVCPLNTVLNWLNEFEKWQEGMKDDECLEVKGFIERFPFPFLFLFLILLLLDAFITLLVSLRILDECLFFCLTGDWTGHSQEASGASICSSAVAGDGGCYDHRLRDVPKPGARQEHQEQEAERDLSKDSGGSRYSIILLLLHINKLLLIYDLFFLFEISVW